MTNLPSRYLITGCAGFVGARTASLLMQRGDYVVGVDNLNNYYDPRLKQFRIEQLGGDQFEFHQLDIENKNDLSRLFSKHKFDGVLNLAARAGVRYSLENPYVYMSTNAEGSLNLLEEMRNHEVPKYVLASTSSLYAGQETPYRESLPVNNPISPYAATKKAAEVMAYSYHHLFGIDVSVVRYFTVYGPVGRPDMSYFRFIKWIDEDRPLQLFGDGSQSRDFTFVDDIAKGTVAALRPLGYEIINLGGGNQPFSINQLIEKIENIMGKKATIHHHPFHNADMTTTWADISKARHLLNWEPTVSLDTGLERCVRWYMDNKPWTADILIP